MTLKDVIKTENIIKASPDDTLSTALGRLSSSHDAIFIFQNDQYLGVINPYYSVIKSSYPGSTKVQNCLFHPPKIHLEDSIERVAQMMSESKIHYLPIFDKFEQFIGITTARRILRYMLQMAQKDRKLGEVVSEKNGKLVTVEGDDTLHEALNLYREHKISKLIMIDKNRKLKGVLSYYDLIPYLVAPGAKQRRATNIDEREKFLQMKVKNYAKKTTLTCGPQNTVGEAIQSILTHQMGSVIVVDGESKPLGIITTRDILNLLKPHKLKKQIELTTKHVSPQYDPLIQDLSTAVSKIIERDATMQRARILIEEDKGGDLFKLSAQLIPVEGEVMAVEKEGTDLGGMIKESKKILAKFMKEKKNDPS